LRGKIIPHAFVIEEEEKRKTKKMEAIFRYFPKGRLGRRGPGAT